MNWKKLSLILLGVLPALGAAETVVTDYTPNTTTVLRNPANGWVLYAADLLPQNAANYWSEVEVFVPTASIVYLRLPWALFEKEEGKYAWDHDAQFKGLVEGARARGLRLAFRVVLNSQDCSVPAAPAYVKAAGAAGYEVGGTGGTKLWSPDPRDPIFRAKFEKFLKAFAAKYDDPAAVDFIDGVGLGFWGEMHHVGTPWSQYPEIYEWICSSYSREFKKVLLGTQVMSEMGGEWGSRDRSLAINKYGYVARLDSLGSHWMQRHMLGGVIRDVPFFAESCYFSLESWDMWKNASETFTNHRQVLDATMKDALDFGANTLDLRRPVDCRTWFGTAPDLVQQFISKGGYRLSPLRIQHEDGVAAGQPLAISHEWGNAGVGFLPNANRRWNFKYRVTFALFTEQNDSLAGKWVDGIIDPGTWRGETVHPQTSNAVFNVAPGRYRLKVAITDTTVGTAPAIALAAGENPGRAAWLPAGWVTVR